MLWWNNVFLSDVKLSIESYDCSDSLSPCAHVLIINTSSVNFYDWCAVDAGRVDFAYLLLSFMNITYSRPIHYSLRCTRTQGEEKHTGTLTHLGRSARKLWTSDSFYHKYVQTVNTNHIIVLGTASMRRQLLSLQHVVRLTSNPTQRKTFFHASSSTPRVFIFRVQT